VRSPASVFGVSRRPDPAPLPYDGVLTVTIGTGLWLIALIVLLPFWSRLREDGHLWWVATAATGFGLGVVGVFYCRRRAAALRRQGRNVGEG
jgi:hypothetical protein